MRWKELGLAIILVVALSACQGLAGTQVESTSEGRTSDRRSAPNRHLHAGADLNRNPDPYPYSNSDRNAAADGNSHRNHYAHAASRGLGGSSRRHRNAVS